MQEVPSGHDPADYVTRRIHAKAHDGELVPITLLYRKTTPLDGSAPLWLYGYGSYGISIPSGFSTNILSLAYRGFIYAIAHIRAARRKAGAGTSPASSTRRPTRSGISWLAPNASSPQA
jgi:oligopeptidase B